MSLAPSPSSPLRLRLQGLRSVDEAVVQIFLRLAASHLRHTWQCSNTDPVDVSLQPPGETLPAPPTQVVWVLPRQQAAPAKGGLSLRQPLQYDAFLELLQALERQLRPSAPVEPAPPPPPPAPVPTLRHYRLKRWPAAQHLAQHRYYARLASFLSTRYLGLADLIRLSNVDAAICTRFLAQMQAAGLLDWREAPSPPPAPTPTATAPAPLTPAAPPPAVPGLIGRLRERLGLQRSTR
ncbi:hypothetical protein [Vitreoscilla filiformis]|jgi:hypothetical protein|uniref:hypothetical protein n=1 Tax=Vitreoscilla filiformis TaxID=63 RepID=UPI000B7A60B2|nr:hypothetical protein [Vitreoscilla filiformis]